MRLPSEMLLVVLVAASCRASPADGLRQIELPNGGPGIGFDDLRFSSRLGIIAPGGRCGKVDLHDGASTLDLHHGFRWTESLVIDATRGRAYTHLWGGATVAIDVHTRAIAETWPNGCASSRGIALDEARGFVFAGCDEGKAVVLDAAQGGRQLSSLSAGAGVDDDSSFLVAHVPSKLTN
jgi:hypothetical protein